MLKDDELADYEMSGGAKGTKLADEQSNNIEMALPTTKH